VNIIVDVNTMTTLYWRNTGKTLRPQAIMVTEMLEFDSAEDGIETALTR
jgi:hypothetical protein